MGTLLIKLAGPLQSWGDASRFTERQTRHEPTKSGVVGLLAAALGRRRTDAMDDLAQLPIAVRIDVPGTYERDFHTAHLRSFDVSQQRWASGKSLPLSQRYYLADAVFVAGIELPDERLVQFAEALVHPAFPLYLGRRSCVPGEKLLLGTRPGVSAREALLAEPWAASSETYRRLSRGGSVARYSAPTIRCELVRDAAPGDGDDLLREQLRDVPLSFSQERREYDFRTVVHEWIYVPNPHAEQLALPEHDPFAALLEVG